ncbi:protein-arginine deiminase [Emydomyces testavorans]|uniref:Protein-arginine deiminase n=1 Tax=Emydomyces testavorans TaxID=2070801 RepID=A0AAF0DKL7_9EURO|nr:protein-arginine deiminase [Emydomyces testavorans]
MRGTFSLLGLLALSHRSAAFKADIRADTNRDGRVDMHGDSDVQGDLGQNSEALFLANIGDTNRRCSQMPQFQGDISSEEIFDTCNDAVDDIQRAPQYMAPLLTIPIKGLSPSASGRISVSNNIARANVRIFRRRDKGWEITDENTTFSSAELAGGLELGIDARDTRRPGKWDGRATVHFTVEDQAQKSTGSVNLRVAPVLTHHHLQRAQQIFVSDLEGDFHKAFFQGLAASVKKAGISSPVYVANTGDQWTQDFFEPGYTSMPGPNGTISLRIMVRSSQKPRTAGRLVFQQFRDTGIGAVQYFTNDIRHTRDSTGNLETIPPYEHNGKKFPAGRVIMGSSSSYQPQILDYLRIQETQDPLPLKTDWLAVQHVDEFLQFLPANTPRGWRLMYGDTEAGLEILKEAQAAGHGQVLAFSRPSEDESYPKFTIAQVVNSKPFQEYNAACANETRHNLDILKRETGLRDEEITAVPALYWDFKKTFEPGNPSRLKLTTDMIGDEEFSIEGDFLKHSILRMALPEASTGESKSLHGREQKTTGALAFYPGAVNGLVLSNEHYLSPQQWGPVIDGRDILQEAVKKVYNSVGYTVDFLDDWYYHIGHGEVHCGTNSARDTTTPWWKA